MARRIAHASSLLSAARPRRTRAEGLGWAGLRTARLETEGLGAEGLEGDGLGAEVLRAEWLGGAALGRRRAKGLAPHGGLVSEISPG